MADSIYAVSEIVGTSTESWERATANAVERASQTLRDLRIVEVLQLDATIEDGRVNTYRARVKLSFKYESPA
jgi:flavin-binding protein dodecin